MSEDDALYRRTAIHPCNILFQDNEFTVTYIRASHDLLDCNVFASCFSLHFQLSIYVYIHKVYSEKHHRKYYRSRGQ